MQGRELQQAFDEDPIIREARDATRRTIINAIIVAADVVPIVGDAVSWTADVLKLSNKLDLTPDVSKLIAWGSEALEFGGFVIPTHIIEAGIQFGHDYKRIQAGSKRKAELRAQ
jgi:hypothetical protein